MGNKWKYKYVLIQVNFEICKYWALHISCKYSGGRNYGISLKKCAKLARIRAEKPLTKSTIGEGTEYLVVLFMFQTQPNYGVTEGSMLE